MPRYQNSQGSTRISTATTLTPPTLSGAEMTRGPNALTPPDTRLEGVAGENRESLEIQRLHKITARFQVQFWSMNANLQNTHAKSCKD